MDIDARFGELLELIYDASLEPSAWDAFLEGFSDAMQATGTMLFLHNFADRRSTTSSPGGGLARHVRADKAFVESFQRHYSQVNMWLENAKHYGEGIPVISSQLYPDADLPKTEFFNDWLKPQGYYYSIGGAVLQRADVSVRLTSLRPRNSGPYTDAELTLYRRLIPHLQRSLRIGQQLDQHMEDCRLREAALNRLTQAVVLLDDGGRVLFANRQAESIFRRGGGLTVVNNRLSAASAQDANGIRESLNRATLGVGSSLRLENPITGRRWVINFSPLRAFILGPIQNARILALISEPDQAHTGALPQFTELYRLTPAETRVLEQLLQQENTQDIADTLQISIRTLRAHLSTLFAKTGTSGQRELVRFFLGHPATL